MRSKVLLTANIASSIYSSLLLWFIGSVLITSGGVNVIKYWEYSLNELFELDNGLMISLNIIYVVMILIAIHAMFITLGMIFGWVGYASKNTGLSTTGAVLYVIATVSFPIYMLFSLPITILGFVGSSKQKELNYN